MASVWTRTFYPREDGVAFDRVVFFSDAVFAISDILALNLLSVLPQMGIEVPRDISLVGFDGIMHSEFVTPPLTTIRQSFEKIAKASVEMLLDIEEGDPEAPLESRQIEPDLRPGGTVASRDNKQLK